MNLGNSGYSLSPNSPFYSQTRNIVSFELVNMRFRNSAAEGSITHHTQMSITVGRTAEIQ